MRFFVLFVVFLICLRIKENCFSEKIVSGKGGGFGVAGARAGKNRFKRFIF